MAERQSFTKEEREASVADVPALGVNAAAKKHGIPQSCVSRWAATAGVRREVEPAPSLAPKAKAGAGKSKDGARPKRKPKGPAADASKREEPVVKGKPKEPAADASKREEPV